MVRRGRTSTSASSPTRIVRHRQRTPNRHVTFGLGGPHFCLGAHLAKIEVKVVLEELLPYLDRLELAGPPTGSARTSSAASNACRCGCEAEAHTVVPSLICSVFRSE